MFIIFDWWLNSTAEGLNKTTTVSWGVKISKQSEADLLSKKTQAHNQTKKQHDTVHALHWKLNNNDKGQINCEQKFTVILIWKNDGNFL